MCSKEHGTIGTNVKPCPIQCRNRIYSLPESGIKGTILHSVNLQLNVGRIVKDLLGIIRLNIIQEAATA